MLTSGWGQKTKNCISSEFCPLSWWYTHDDDCRYLQGCWIAFCRFVVFTDAFDSKKPSLTHYIECPGSCLVTGMQAHPQYDNCKYFLCIVLNLIYVKGECHMRFDIYGLLILKECKFCISRAQVKYCISWFINSWLGAIGCDTVLHWAKYLLMILSLWRRLVDIYVVIGCLSPFQ